MKVTNLSAARIYLRDLKSVHQAQTEGRRGEDRYLGPGQSVYLPNTSEVLRSAISGDLRKFQSHGIVSIEDTVDLDASGGANDSVVLTHDFGFPPGISVLKQVGPLWVDATGTIDVSHNATFTQTTIANTTAFPLTFLIRLL